MNEQNIQSFYTYLQSQQTAQQFLRACYQKIDGINADVKSYQNCNAFTYYVRHGKHFYETGKTVTPELQPILYFYGMAHLLKACLLTKRPDYPETTKLLAHGVSSRKRKRKDYTFMQDEVKIHQNGLFPYFSEHLFQVKKWQVDKFKMAYLFGLIPEMTPLFKFENIDTLTIIGKTDQKTLTFPIHLLDNYYSTNESFLQRIAPHLPEGYRSENEKKSINIKLPSALTKSSGPFFLHITEKLIYFPSNREYFLPISEVMVHYLLLYNLSMLSRYETEWWGDLLGSKSDLDYPFISQFLQHTSDKIPLLLGNELYQQYLTH